MKKSEKYIKIIQKDFPNFSISSLRKIGEGDNSVAFSVNNKYVFRFPKHYDAKLQMQREIITLPIIRLAVNLSIPNFEFISPDKSFVGYQAINGVPLTSEIYTSLTATIQDDARQSIAEFLSQLHHIDLFSINNCGLEKMDLKKDYAETFAQAKDIIYPNVSTAKRQVISDLFLSYLGNPENFAFSPSLIHNDFSKDHILFDIVKQQITGIIDFGDIALGDPDYDFMYLYDEFGEDFLNGIVRIDNPNNQHKLIKKLKFFSLANKIQIIFMEKEAYDSEALEEAYSTLDAWLQKHISTLKNS